MAARRVGIVFRCCPNPDPTCRAASRLKLLLVDASSPWPSCLPTAPRRTAGSQFMARCTTSPTFWTPTQVRALPGAFSSVTQRPWDKLGVVLVPVPVPVPAGHGPTRVSQCLTGRLSGSSAGRHCGQWQRIFDAPTSLRVPAGTGTIVAPYPVLRHHHH